VYSNERNRKEEKKRKIKIKKGACHADGRPLFF
jgi:hypothetical protein